MEPILSKNKIVKYEEAFRDPERCECSSTYEISEYLLPYGFCLFLPNHVLGSIYDNFRENQASCGTNFGGQHPISLGFADKLDR